MSAPITLELFPNHLLDCTTVGMFHGSQALKHLRHMWGEELQPIISMSFAATVMGMIRGADDYVADVLKTSPAWVSKPYHFTLPLWKPNDTVQELHISLQVVAVKTDQGYTYCLTVWKTK